MKKLPSFITAEETSTRLSDRPPESKPVPWGRIIGGMAAFIIFGPYLLFCGCLFVGWKTQEAIDHWKGPLRLESAVKLSSPDNRMRFEADTDGAIRLIRLPNGKVIHQQRISVDDYRKIEAQWQGNEKIRLTCDVRYRALAGTQEYFWHCQSGALDVAR